MASLDPRLSEKIQQLQGKYDVLKDYEPDELLRILNERGQSHGMHAGNVERRLKRLCGDNFDSRPRDRVQSTEDPNQIFSAVAQSDPLEEHEDSSFSLLSRADQLNSEHKVELARWRGSASDSIASHSAYDLLPAEEDLILEPRPEPDLERTQKTLPYGSPRRQSMEEQELTKPIFEDQPWPGWVTAKWLDELKQPLHGEFVFEGSVQRHKFVAMPRGYVCSKKELVALAKHWGLTLPNLIVIMNSCCHDSGELVCKEMIDGHKGLPDYISLAADAELSVHPGGDVANDLEARLRTANKHLKSGLTDLWGQLTSACAVTNSWIMLKQDRGRGGNDALLKEVMRSGTGKPVFLDVLDLASAERAGSIRRTLTVKWMDAQEFINQLALLDGNEYEHEHHPPKQSAERKWEEQVVSLASGTHKWHTYAGWAVWQVEGDQHGQGYHTGDTGLNKVQGLFKSLAERRQGQLRVTVERGCFSNEHVIHQAAANSIKLRDHAQPWNVPLGEPVTIKRVPGDGYVNFPWSKQKNPEEYVKNKQYVSWAYFNSEATHHVFASDAAQFDAGLLAPVGNIFSGGNSRTSVNDDWIKTMQRGLPCIFVDNTGGQATEFARLIQAITDQATDSTGKQFHVRQGISMPSLRQHVKLGQTDFPARGEGGWMEHLTTADVLAVCQLYEDHAGLFDETIITVNPLRHSPNEMLTRLSKCIASVQTSPIEIGAGPADHNAVLDAWHVHHTLTASATRERTWADRLAALAIVVTFLATATAIFDSWISVHVEEDQQGWGDWKGSLHEQMLKCSVALLPAMGGLIAAVIAEGSYSDKWAAPYMAAIRIRGELYHFRMRVGRYSIALDEDGSEHDGDDVSTRMLRARQMFSARVQTLTRQTLSQQVSEPVGSLQKGGRIRMTMADLDEHVTNITHARKVSEFGSNQSKNHRVPITQPGVYPALGPLKTIEAQSDVEGTHAQPMDISTSVWLRGDMGELSDNETGPAEWQKHVGSLTSQVYFFTRVLPMLHWMERDALRLQRIYITVQVVSMVAATFATVLGVTGHSSWVPVAVSTTTVLSSVLEHYKLKVRLTNTTQAIVELRALVSEWEAMGEIAKCMPEARARLVHVTESVELSHARGWIPTWGP